MLSMPAGREADILCVARQHINILTVGSPNGIGGFFPNGLNGVITSPFGFNVTDPRTEDIPKYAISSGQARPAPARAARPAPACCAYCASMYVLSYLCSANGAGSKHAITSTGLPKCMYALGLSCAHAS